MTAWVALLRGVNVGGVTIRNADLAALMTGALGFSAVRTVLASGNVSFETDAAPSARATLKRSIETALWERFGYDAWIVLVTRAEVEKAIEAFPFDAADSERQPWVIFGSDDAVLDELIEAAASFDGDADPVSRGDGVIYWNPVKGTTVDTAFGKLLARKAYRSSTTNRNLRTLHKIADG
ncbi:Uncharacterized conserved protein, DUF1697 family [Microbacterium sp. cf046]|uniref:DUF1697 domain-containing protein n=1 Tax=Microbacterium sp. cf046 TaxID=1761803 RepID=UPI0008E8BC5D|nr:DUF1697 domain-containing protein [Microbacterium sp. cf046]SFS04959.1 Uncharacterized conserved protein, DUF1697 family [Microbacterium sp. cf046]